MPTWPSIPRRPGFPAKGPDEWVIEADGVVFDGLRRRVQVDGYLVRLPGREAAVLSVLIARPGQVVNWSALLSAVWSDTSGAHHSAVDRLLRRLRRRLEPSPLSRTRIHRIGETGYLFGSRANAR